MDLPFLSRLPVPTSMTTPTLEDPDYLRMMPDLVFYSPSINLMRTQLSNGLSSLKV